ncbi:MAG TPA: glycosyltransferase family 4 protein, partial [Solirubrobacteraceae bacterium]|nr:glycosyltransferase family 4 protein [Solirubrobacteraceae bacterium]
KGVDTAIDACHRAGVPLTVAGDGPLRDALQDRARRLGADVNFTGRVSTERLAALRASASVAVVPSRSAETFGLAAAEAMAAGLPVAATEIGALGELVPHEQLAPPGDPEALAATILHARGRRDLAEEGLARVRAHAAPEVVAPLLEAVYDGRH